MLNNRAPAGGYTWTTYPERLQAAGSELESVPAAGQLRLQHAEEFQGLPAGASGFSLCIARHADRPGRTVRVRRQAMTNFPPSPGSSRPVFNPSIPTTCPPRERPSSPARSMQSRPTPTYGQKPPSSSITMRTTDSSTMCLRRFRRGTPHEFVKGLPIGGGFRVPCIIVSPWTAGGWVCSELIRPYFRASIPGGIHRRARAKHHRMAPAHFRQPDVGLSI